MHAARPWRSEPRADVATAPKADEDGGGKQEGERQHLERLGDPRPLSADGDGSSTTRILCHPLTSRRRRGSPASGSSALRRRPRRSPRRAPRSSRARVVRPHAEMQARLQPAARPEIEQQQRAAQAGAVAPWRQHRQQPLDDRLQPAGVRATVGSARAEPAAGHRPGRRVAAAGRADAPARPRRDERCRDQRRRRAA